MKITDVRTVPVSRYLFVQVLTNEGITGLGESGTWGFLEASEQAIETFNEKRAEIEALFNRSDLPCPGARKRALKYLKSFYDTINDPRKVQKHIVKACRG